MNLETDIVEDSTINQYDFNNLEFGKVFTDLMIESDFSNGQWGEYTMGRVKPLSIHPGASVLHYGQAIFEGLKAYNLGDGRINLFRLKDNIARLNRSAYRMAMPQFDEDILVDKIKELVAAQKQWVPTREQGSLYVRPVMIATSNTLRAVASTEYKLMVICCPVGFYYNKPLSVKLEKDYGRAAKGGIGYAKAAGNYAGSFMPSNKAKSEGYDQIIWTSINSNFTLEELGSANLFFVKDGVLHTPSIRDSILPGITRDTIINIAKEKGFSVNEGLFPADEFKKDLASGSIDCVFATGTAASVTFINKITIDGDHFEVTSDSHQPVNDFAKELEAYKFAENDDTHGWNNIV